MKLEFFGVDFEEGTISLQVPPDIMQKASWKAGTVDVNIGDICDIANEPANQADHGSAADIVSPARLRENSRGRQLY